jgi:hypothetical protein
MQSVEFNEPEFDNIQYIPNNPRTPVLNLVIKMHLAKNPQQATRVMLFLTIVFFVMSLYFFQTFIFKAGNNSVPTTYIK